MCGISGYIGKEMIAPAVISQTLERMKNRGPDHQDYRQFSEGDLRIYLLHSRLSIIDLDERSHQPFTIGDCTLVFNGEIYNYIELRLELEKQGHYCRTDSDTEVLLRYYLLYGTKCVDYFEGMWSFAIWDGRKKHLFVSRDRFAEKPLYYYRTETGIYFGSEVKFIKNLSGESLTVNETHLFRYMINGYKSLYKTGETFYREIRELPFASNMVIDGSLHIREERYWKPVYEPRKMTLTEAVEGTRERLLNSVKLRLRADVPLAFCLSGGVDSSGLASLAAGKLGYHVVTYSIIDSDERYNEYDNIKTTIDAIGSQYTLIHLKHEHTLEKLRDLIRYHDSPIATISYLIHSYISQAVSRDGYKVVFSGTGADELFTGYYDHFLLHLYELRNHPDYETYLEDWHTHTGKFVRNPILKNPRLYMEDPTMRAHVYDDSETLAAYLDVDFKEAFKETDYCSQLLRNRMFNEMFHEVIPVILHEDDLNSMKYSVENRSPYLDRHLFEFAASIPVEYLIRDGYGKYVLREALKGSLNDPVRLDRRKKGFNASIRSIVDFQDKNDREFLLDDGPVFQWVNKGRLEALFQRESIPNSLSKFLFAFINTRIFLEEMG